MPVSARNWSGRSCGSVVTIEPFLIPRRATSNVAAPCPPPGRP